VGFIYFHFTSIEILFLEFSPLGEKNCFKFACEKLAFSSHIKNLSLFCK